MAEDSELCTYLQNLDEFIYDEDRIVTYKWLSRTLSVTSNQAKQMLFAFLRKQKQTNSMAKLSVTYLIGGRKGHSGELFNQYVLATDHKLEETKAQFRPVTSLHIYSIQKQQPKDTNSLYMVDYGISNEHKGEENRWSHVCCKEATRLTDGGVGRGSAQGPPGKENSLPSTSSKMVNGNGSSTEKAKSVTTHKPKKGQLPTMGMFTVKSDKKTEESKPSKQQDKAEVPAKKPEKPKSSGGMISFFGKPTAGPAKKQESTHAKPATGPGKKQEAKHESPVPEKNEDKDVKIGEMEDKPQPEPKQKPGKSKQTRKRIKQFDEDEDEEDPLPRRIAATMAKDTDSEEETEKAKKSNVETKRRKQSSEDKKGKRAETASKKRSSVNKEDESKEKKPKKKRKRTKDVQSDESSDEESPVQSTEPSVVTETPIQEQQTRARISESAKRRKRRKVLHSKTYMNDEGFMVTEKVYESESTDASDNEAAELKPQVEQKKPSPQSKAKKEPDPKSTKQASLMSFFGKK